ncbi:unnamed protein product [Rotaria magnacalcarata]|uniref:Uncharacterized protein n=1 Tax=Rotaria magnacalcarata TaxID=392030 RepID=A0A819UKY7_9BILA|nr:unnamed protein product [Rotaria magnacalcarata]
MRREINNGKQTISIPSISEHISTGKSSDKTAMEELKLHLEKQLIENNMRHNEPIQMFKRGSNNPVQAEVPSTDEDRAWVEFNIGRALDCKGQLKEAEKDYIRAYKRMKEDGPTRLKDAAHVLNSRGDVNYGQKKYDEALKYNQMTLEIQEKCCPSDHVNIAKSLMNIAKKLTCQEKHDTAFDYYQQASTVFEKCSPTGSVDLADTFNSIGIYQETQKNLRIALDYFKCALTLNVKFLPVDHKSV